MKLLLFKISIILYFVLFPFCLKSQSDSTNHVGVADSSTNVDSLNNLKPVYWYPIYEAGLKSYVQIDSSSVLDLRIAKHLNQGSKDIKASYLALATGVAFGAASGFVTESNTRLYLGVMSGVSGLLSIGLGVSGGIQLQKATDLMVLRACPNCVSIKFRIK